MLKARFRIQLPGDIWIRAVSQEFPDATFRLLACTEVDDQMVELGMTKSADIDEVIEACRTHPSMESYEVLSRTDDTAIVRNVTEDTHFQMFLDTVEQPPEFPIDVTDGYFEFDLTGTRELFEGFCDGLEASPARYELVSVVQRNEDGTLLTDRQEEILETALRNGFFEVPRECTVAELAAELDVDKSTVSGVLRRGQARIVKDHLSGPRVPIEA